MVKITLRMNLFDFLNKPFEEDVIKKLEDGSLKPKDLKEFLVKYEKRLHFKTNIKVGNELKFNDFIWFDIISQNYVDTSNRIRFQYTYNSKEDILKGLDEFHKCAKFCTSDKPARKQKRNDL